MQFEVELNKLEQTNFELVMRGVEQVQNNLYYLLEQRVIVDCEFTIDVSRCFGIRVH